MMTTQRLRNLTAAVLTASAAGLLCGCEQSADESGSDQSTEAQQSQEVGTSQSTLGKARDTAEKTVDDLEQRQKELSDMADSIGRDEE